MSPRHSSSPPLETSELSDAAQRPSVAPAQEQPLPPGLGQPWEARQGSRQGPGAGEADSSPQRGSVPLAHPAGEQRAAGELPHWV